MMPSDDKSRRIAPHRTIGYAGLSLMTGLSRRTLQRYLKSGLLPPSAVVKYSRAIRFRVDEIELWIASRTLGADSPDSPAGKSG